MSVDVTASQEVKAVNKGLYSQNSIQRGARLLKIELVISDFVISKTNVLGMEEKGFFRNWILGIRVY